MAICIGREFLKDLTLAEVRRLLAESKLDKLSAVVELHLDSGGLYVSDFFCIVFRVDHRVIYRCDELLGQLKGKDFDDMRCVLLTLVGDEVRLEYETPPHDPAICGRVVARCELKKE